MSLATLLLFILLPAVVLLGYSAIKTQSSLMREAMWIGFAGGVGIGLAVCLWQQILDQALPPLPLQIMSYAAARAMLVIALPDEACKLLLLLILVRHVIRIADTRDIVLASLGISFGFAAMKDVAFLIQAYQSGARLPGLTSMLGVVSVVPQHVITGLAMGALVAFASRSIRISLWCLPPALIVPLAMHAGYEFLLLMYRYNPGVYWTFHMLPVVMASSMLLSILLCNAIMPQWHRYHDRRGADGTKGPAWLGLFLMVLSVSLAYAMLSHPALAARQTVSLFCIMPMILAVDLLTTAFGRMRLQTGMHPES